MNGRKRHIATDTMGYLLASEVHAANLADTTMAPSVALALFALCPKIAILFIDAGYKGKFIQWLNENFGIKIEIGKKVGSGFQVIRKRWVVERTFAWFTRQRRLTRDYERTTDSSNAMINIAMIRIMLKQLSPVQNPWRKGEIWSPLLNNAVPA